MNHPIRKYVVLIFGLACLTACQNELWQNGSADGHVKIFARMRPSATTRTCVDGTATDGTVGILWTPGDNIGVYGTNGTANAVFASTNTGAAPEAVFSGNLKQERHRPTPTIPTVRTTHRRMSRPSKVT